MACNPVVSGTPIVALATPLVCLPGIYVSGASRIIDVSPGAGHDGGRIVFRGQVVEEMDAFLRSTDVINFDAPAVRARAAELRGGQTDTVAVVRRCFEWVRDQIKHSRDFRLQPVTCSASQVLEEGSGYCYPKSHLLAALLRANGIPAGLCYQRLAVDEPATRFCLHGLNAVFLPEFGWYRLDPRGNRAGVDAQFTPPVEQLAFAVNRPGEFDLPGVWPDPLPVVVDALRAYTRADDLYDELPDLTMWSTPRESRRSASAVS